MIALGGTTITKAYLGSTELKNVAIGDELLLSQASPYDEYGYIKAGKVFHLDGINKGNTADTWADLVGGYTFPYNGVSVALQNGMQFGGGTKEWLLSDQSTTKGQFDEDTYTIECCFDKTSGIYIFGTGNSGSLMFACDSTNSGFHYHGKNTSTNLYGENVSNVGAHTVSCSESLGICDGTSMTKWQKTSYRQGGGKISIGARSYGSANPFKGVVYSIRIYNRFLTLAEILNNQTVDNTRFNLGLNI